MLDKLLIRQAYDHGTRIKMISKCLYLAGAP